MQCHQKFLKHAIPTYINVTTVIVPMLTIPFQLFCLEPEHHDNTSIKIFFYYVSLVSVHVQVLSFDRGSYNPNMYIV